MNTEEESRIKRLQKLIEYWICDSSLNNSYRDNPASLNSTGLM